MQKKMELKLLGSWGNIEVYQKGILWGHRMIEKAS